MMSVMGRWLLLASCCLVAAAAGRDNVLRFLNHEQTLRMAKESQENQRTDHPQTQQAVVSSLVKNVVCPGGQSECLDGETCCQLASGQWGCCPYSQAVCCSDHIHCCPHGYTCDLSAGTCNMTGGQVSVPWVEKKPAVSSLVKNVVCPGGQSQCPDGETCCQLASGQWGCCPYNQAVCCSDHIHCCPHGYTCDVSAGTCNTTGGQVSVPWVEKNPAVSRFLKTKTNAETELSLVKGVVCPGGQAECPDGSTCCKLSDAQWGCCPYNQAVCCSDHIHCCPHGDTCDVSAGTCNTAGGQVSVPWVEKKPAVSRFLKTKTNAEIELSLVKGVVWPGGQSQCPDGSTCCQLASGQWGCCPYNQIK